MGALDQPISNGPSGRSRYFGGVQDSPDGTDAMTDYQRANVDLRKKSQESNEAFRTAEATRRAEQAGQRAVGVQTRFDRTMNSRQSAQDDAQKRFDRTMDSRQSAQDDVQSRFDETMTLRQQTEDRQMKNQELLQRNDLMRLKRDADKDALALKHDSDVMDHVGKFDKEVESIQAAYADDPIKANALIVAAARKYPYVSKDERTMAQVKLSNDLLKEWGVHPHLATALWEVGQFDPASIPDKNQARNYLGTIAAKYPAVANNKAFADALKEKAVQIDPNEKPLAQRLSDAEAMSAAQAKGTASAKVGSVPETVATLYSKTKGELAGIISTAGEMKGAAKIAAKQKETEARTVLRDLERRHPLLAATPVPGLANPAAPVVPAAATVSLDIDGTKKILQEAGGAAPSVAPSFQTAEDVRNAFRAGKVDRATAEEILRKDFGHK